MIMWQLYWLTSLRRQRFPEAPEAVMPLLQNSQDCCKRKSLVVRILPYQDLKGKVDSHYIMEGRMDFSFDTTLGGEPISGSSYDR